MAEELVEAGATAAALMNAQGFDPAPLDYLDRKLCRRRNGSNGASTGVT
jgi:hypothetical protein